MVSLDNMFKNFFTFEKSRQRGFTLLLAALVASIVLALGSSIFTIAKKQVTLSSLGRDSQFAFYAADTAAECALYYDVRLSSFATSSGITMLPIQCDGVVVTPQYYGTPTANSAVTTFRIQDAAGSPVKNGLFWQDEAGVPQAGNLPAALGLFVIAMLALGIGNGAVFQLVPQRFGKEIGVMTGLVGFGGGVGGFYLASSLGIIKKATGSTSIGFSPSGVS